MTKRTFTREQLEELEIDAGGDSVVHTELIDQRRWYDVHEAVFKYDDKLWSVAYKVGSTEEQEQDTWDSEVEAVEVEPFETVVTKYRRTT
jgi:hypothetical protein